MCGPGDPAALAPGLRSTASKVQSVSIARRGGLEGKGRPAFSPFCPCSLAHFPVAIIEHMFYNWDENADREGSAVERRSKVYVKVTADFLPDKTILPRQIVWEDGRVYTVDRVRDIRPAASLKVGGAGLRYLCVIGGRETYLFLEDGSAWFVEKKERGG